DAVSARSLAAFQASCSLVRQDKPGVPKNTRTTKINKNPIEPDISSLCELTPMLAHEELQSSRRV
ncbi:MAG TPA: hypothetical protein VEI57_13510, partial [Nitrospirota bacterium]|nr:hypothetical protein [Nitrospirota bacterium]